MLLLWLSVKTVTAQSAHPLRGHDASRKYWLQKNDTPLILIQINEKGEIKAPPPAGFALMEKRSYNIRVIVDSPHTAHKALLKYLREQCLAAYEILDNKQLSTLHIYVDLYGRADLDTLKAQLWALADILDEEDVQEALKNSPHNFDRLLGKAFLTQQLFGTIFTLRFGKKDISLPFDQKAVLDTTITTVDENVRLPILVADMKKQFIRAYFTASRDTIAPLIDGMRPRVFYDDILPAAGGMSKKYEDLLKEVKKEDGPFICDDDVLNRFRKLNEQFYANTLIRILRTKWLLCWTWYMAGDLRLNPLGFTDKALLPVLKGDTNKVKDYNAYVQSAKQLMIHSNELNEAKINYRLMDSLLRLQGKGEELFGEAAQNSAQETRNKESAATGQKVLHTINSSTMRVVSGRKPHLYLLLSYNAANKLKGSTHSKTITYTADVTAEAMAYNIAAGQQFQVKQSSSPIPDKSSVISELDNIGSIAEAALTAANSAVPGWTQMINISSPPSPQPSSIRVGFLATPSVGAAAPHIPEATFLKSKPSFRVRVHNEGRNQLILLETGTGGRLIHKVNIADSMWKVMRTYCYEVRNDIMEEMQQQIRNDTSETFFLFEEAELAFYKTAEQLRIQVNGIMEKIHAKYFDRNTQAVSDTILARIQFLNGAGTFFGYPKYILPPAIFKAQADTIPAFRNQYETLATTETPQKNSLEPLITDKKTGETVVKTTDSYKSAKPHFITSSLGVAWIPNRFQRSDATLSNGTITNTRDEANIRLITGIHFHPVRIILADDRSVFRMKSFREVASRTSLFLGASFPKPLYNLHFGGSVDIWTGVKASAGIHVYRYTKYTVLNNQVTKEESKYLSNGLFLSLSITPATFVKLIGLFNL
ncbi:hypothetical protein [Chitinophaga cymbidii]|uniref:Uncharacterized protein n=1 Tax=Chitinophaga cymbidii TaxID=1096750 RepID=A0A512RQK5_9BACT|nr:hypothetical protein [Chitinophaga cymbidii]GEP97976.1 hypothetical protein CCY01nite_42360 [Chitinophaga cymbidii]